jgi:GNAT superfamily N-acetyltransferase
MTAVIGLDISIAPAGPDDGPAIDALLERCSVQTRYRRFFSPVHALPVDYRAGVLAGDPTRHDALLARAPGPDGPVIGLASLVSGPDAAELGVLVQDDRQHEGIGTALVVALVERARGRGERCLRATVLPFSGRLLRWLAKIVPMQSTQLSGDSATGLFPLV